MKRNQPPSSSLHCTQHHTIVTESLPNGIEWNEMESSEGFGRAVAFIVRAASAAAPAVCFEVLLVSSEDSERMYCSFRDKR